MKIFITGATGMIGSALCLALRRRGHELCAWVRNPDAARNTLGAEVELVPTTIDDAALRELLADCDAVINLAGAPVAQRWTARAKRAIRDSRVDLTRRLVSAMDGASERPKVLISTSAVGVYGDRGGERLDADSEPGDAWISTLCLDWEREALRAEALGVRVAIIRVGLVLGREGGVLGPMLPVFRAGFGGRLGSGTQWMPWIHLDDVVRLYLRALDDASFVGVYEGTAPGPVQNREFTRALGRSLGRPTIFPIPAFMLRLGFGGAAEVMLAGQRVEPRRTLEQGFVFEFETLNLALASILDPRGVNIQDAKQPPPSEYLRERGGARHCLTQVTLVDAPLEQVFSYFERPENLGPLTPAALAFDIQTPGPLEMRAGARIEYRIALGPIPMSWNTQILSYEPGEGFVDAQTRGPYRAWFHEHVFEARGGQTHMIDRVYYTVPLGPLGRIAHWLFVAPQLRRIFAFRSQAIERRFGVDAGAQQC